MGNSDAPLNDLGPHSAATVTLFFAIFAVENHGRLASVGDPFVYCSGFCGCAYALTFSHQQRTSKLTIHSGIQRLGGFFASVCVVLILLSLVTLFLTQTSTDFHQLGRIIFFD